jgi:hypothetical protein
MRVTLVTGKLAIIGMLSVAGCLALFGWWWRYEQANQASAWWGNQHIHAILTPESATAFRVHPLKADEASADSTELFEFQKVKLEGEKPVEITNARGFLHARHSLTQDISFEWSGTTDAEASPSVPRWEYGLRLLHGNKPTTLLFDFEQRWLGIVEAQKRIRLVEHTNRGWQSYLQRTLETRVEQGSATPGS